MDTEYYRAEIIRIVSEADFTFIISVYSFIKGMISAKKR